MVAEIIQREPACGVRIGERRSVEEDGGHHSEA
jgi:hypothetical protein